MTLEQRLLQFRNLVDESVRADRAVRERAERLFPAGADIAWTKGGYTQSGLVVGHTFGGFRVHNRKTGKTLDISHFDVAEAVR